MSQSSTRLLKQYPKRRTIFSYAWMHQGKEKFEFSLRFHQCSLNVKEDLFAILRLNLGNNSIFNERQFECNAAVVTSSF
jgi:hypothetical protein